MKMKALHAIHTSPQQPLPALKSNVLRLQAASSIGNSSSSPSLALSRGLSDSARRQLSWWLGSCSAWVFSMVVLGGVTRLTRSGLSMTDWKFTGTCVVKCQAGWHLCRRW